jgi:integrase
VFRAFRQALTWAVARGLCDRDAGAGIRNPKRKGHDRRPVFPFETWEEVEEVCAQLDRHRVMPVVAVGCGFRPEELFGLHRGRCSTHTTRRHGGSGAMSWIDWTALVLGTVQALATVFALYFAWRAVQEAHRTRQESDQERRLAYLERMAIALAEKRRNYDQATCSSEADTGSGSGHCSKRRRVLSFGRRAPMPNGNLGTRIRTRSTGTSATRLRGSSRTLLTKGFGPRPGHEIRLEWLCG